ncbi:MAG: FIST C-terminal domain-containing protein [Gemmatimonadota bacterium]
MHAFTTRWSLVDGWQHAASPQSSDTQLLLAFGPLDAPTSAFFDEARVRWPKARLVYCSGGWLIDRNEVVGQCVVVMGMAFERGWVRVEERSSVAEGACESIGRALVQTLSADPELRHILAFTDGQYINGAAFARGMASALPEHVTVSGGLASDGTHFTATGVGVDRAPAPKRIVAIGLYGNVVVGTGSSGGWEAFGPERLVTGSDGADVFSLDGEPALDVYCRYLGPLAAELPGSALLFPLSLASPDGGPSVVRTILGVDREAGSLRSAGDVPQGYRVRLMRSTNDRLVDGAVLAAETACAQLGEVQPAALLCVSCIGRHTLLRARIDEELYEVARAAGSAAMAGYYSNGEIAPPNGMSEGPPFLHNQTMTITAIGER